MIDPLARRGEEYKSICFKALLAHALSFLPLSFHVVSSLPMRNRRSQSLSPLQPLSLSLPVSLAPRSLLLPALLFIIFPSWSTLRSTTSSIICYLAFRVYHSAHHTSNTLESMCDGLRYMGCAIRRVLVILSLLTRRSSRQLAPQKTLNLNSSPY